MMMGAVVVSRVVVDADVLLLPLGAGAVVGVSRFQAGEDRFVEGVVEPRTQGILGVDLVADVAGLDPGVSVVV